MCSFFCPFTSYISPLSLFLFAMIYKQVNTQTCKPKEIYCQTLIKLPLLKKKKKQNHSFAFTKQETKVILRASVKNQCYKYISI